MFLYYFQYMSPMVHQDINLHHCPVYIKCHHQHKMKYTTKTKIQITKMFVILTTIALCIALFINGKKSELIIISYFEHACTDDTLY